MSQWSPGSGGGVPLFAHIAAGVFLGLVAAAFVIWRVAVWQAEVAVAEAAATLQRMSASVTQQQRQARDAAIAQQRAQRELAASAQRAEEATRRQNQDEAARREAAWATFYQKSVACDQARGGVWSVDCANEFMRAKRRFAELYDAGKL